MDQMIEFDVLLNVGFNENLRYLYLIMWFMSVVDSYGLLMYVVDEECDMLWMFIRFDIWLIRN